MPRFAANLSMLFNEVAFLERFEKAQNAGFRAVEFMSPFEHPAQAVAQRLHDHDLEMVLFNMPAGDRPRGDRGIACQPARQAEFRESVKVALEYAHKLEARYINCLAGIAPAGVEQATLHGTYVENLRYVCEAAKQADVKVVIEPLNPIDFPGFLLTRTDQAAAIVAEVDADNLGIEYDVYHAQVAEGNLAATLERFLPKIWHMQVADVPTRQEPGTGEVRFEYLFAELDRMGYAGWIGCDYHPSTTDDRHMDWVRQYL
jgi:hydroxypyruvate isomerase